MTCAAAAVPWQAVVGRMLAGEVAEIEVAPVPSTVAAGFAPFGVPADRTVVLSVTLLSWITQEDISTKRDGSITKRVLDHGDAGWHKPRKLYRTTVNVQLLRAPGDPEPYARCDCVELEVGAVRSSSDIATLATGCGGVASDGCRRHARHVTELRRATRREARGELHSEPMLVPLEEQLLLLSGQLHWL